MTTGRWRMLGLAALLVAVSLLNPFGVIGQVSGPIFAPDGSRQQPSYNFATSPRLGIFRVEKDNAGFVADGQVVYHYTTTLLHVLNGITLRVGGPVYLQSALGVGTDNPTSNVHVVGTLSVTGSTAFSGAVTIVNGTITGSTITSGGNLLASPDNALDIGQSGATRYRDAFLARNLHVGGYTHFGATTSYGVHAINIANDATGNGNAEILSGAVAPVLRITCNDTQGCTLRFSETGAVPGTILRVVNIGPNSILVSDHATVGTRQHLAASGALTGTANTTLQLIYMNMHATGTEGWYELSRSVN